MYSPKTQKISVNIQLVAPLFLATSTNAENWIEWAEAHKNSCERNNGNQSPPSLIVIPKCGNNNC